MSPKNFKKLLDEVFVISAFIMIKAEVSVVSRAEGQAVKT